VASGGDFHGQLVTATDGRAGNGVRDPLAAGVRRPPLPAGGFSVDEETPEGLGAWLDEVADVQVVVAGIAREGFVQSGADAGGRIAIELDAEAMRSIPIVAIFEREAFEVAEILGLQPDLPALDDWRPPV
jgi:hypothetical protein